ncbi:hypothetical protein BJ165DRAFT_1481337 [Panaeolus papilionaceus]|nr:hypothetical protein BJ165DRAFT_1481337 [Panaeolus papilionaceus]
MHRRRWSKSLHARDPGAVAGWNDTPLRPLFSYIFLGASVETLLYGMHVILFVTCMRILLRRPRRRKAHISMLLVAVVMFVLSAADVALSWNIGINHADVLFLGNTSQLYLKIYPKIILFYINSIIADILLIIRCYVVWGRCKLILYIGGAIFVGIVALGIYSEAAPSLGAKSLITYYVIAIAVFNIIITIMTALRIYWVARQARMLIGRKLMSQHRVAVGIVVESGLLYTASAILAVGLSQTNYALLGSAISSRVIGIMPILIIVRVTMGKAVQDVETTVSRMKDQDTTIPFPQSEVGNELPLGLNNRVQHRDMESAGQRTHGVTGIVGTPSLII